MDPFEEPDRDVGSRVGVATVYLRGELRTWDSVVTRRVKT